MIWYDLENDKCFCYLVVEVKLLMYFLKFQKQNGSEWNYTYAVVY